MLIRNSKLQQGDILVQIKGEPWVTGTKLLTGYPYPHATLVADPYEWSDTHFLCIENTAWGVQHVVRSNLADFEIWRPRCSDEIKQKAIQWVQSRENEPYNYFKFVEIGLAYKLPYFNQQYPNMDDDISKDARRKVCSELIAMAFYRSGYDLVPHISDIQTMPWDLRNPYRLVLIPQEG